MKQKYRLAERARQHLYEIADYIGERNPTASRRVLQSLRDTFSVLAANPGIGQSRSDLHEGLRVFPAKRPAHNYVILYYRTASSIEISAVVHGARDWENMVKRGELDD